MNQLVKVMLVGIGSMLGGMLRYLVSLWTQSKGWTAFPWATLIVNVVGCFLIAFILTAGAASAMRVNLRLFLTTGVMGGLTTYSSFNFETTRLFQDGAPISAVLNLAATLVVCFVAGILGIVAAHAVVSE